MNAVKQVNSGEEAAIVLASVSLKRKAENTELSNSIDSRDEIPERGLQQVGRNDPSGVVGEGPTKKKGRFELTETSSDFFSGRVFFTDTDHSQDSRGREGTIFYSLYHFHPFTNIEAFICHFTCEMTIAHF